MRAADEYGEVVEYVAHQAPMPLSVWLSASCSEFAHYDDFPRRGGFSPEDSAQLYRQLIEGNYRIIYRCDRDVVIIASTYHAARLLRSEDLP